MTDVTGEVVEVSITDGEVTVEQKSTKGKKIGCGCGCGCLLVIIAIILAIIFILKAVMGFVTGFEEKGYERIDGQALVIAQDDTRKGSVVYFAQSVTIDGTIDGNVAAMCQVVIVNGTINGDLDLLCQTVTITETGVVTGDIRSKGVQLLDNKGTVHGTISGDIQIIKGNKE